MIDSSTYRHVLGHYPTGVSIITSLDPDGRPIGMCVGTFTSVSLDPALVAFLPDRRSSTWRKILGSARFCVNVLSDQQTALSKRFASPMNNRFDGLAYSLSDLGNPILEGVVAWIDCELHAVHAAGDHFIAIGAVSALGSVPSAQPLVFHRGVYNQIQPAAKRPAMID